MNLFEATHIVENFLETPWEEQPENLLEAANFWAKGTAEYTLDITPDLKARLEQNIQRNLKYQVKASGIINSMEGYVCAVGDLIKDEGNKKLDTAGRIYASTKHHLDHLLKLKETNHG